MRKEILTERIDLRLPKTLFDEFVRLAEKDDRALSDYTRRVLKDHAARSKSKKARGA